MKLSARPISSPGRTEKFPPPLMRFLRSNVGSRSRGRSRSSPMFVRKKTTAIETQEPSSPKVTCMGQVRVRRSSKQKAPKRHKTPASRRRCWWLRRALFCHVKIRPCQPLWPKWGFFRRKVTKFRQDSARTESNFRERNNEDVELEEDGYENRANANTNSSVSTTPPKNALLLTRCRSAPYRSSSLACRFWGSPLRGEETGEEQRTAMENTELTEDQQESISDKEERIDPTTEEKIGFFKELEDSIKERMIKSENVQELKGIEEAGDSARPLILTRCKSEPVRTTQKLDPELNFWKKRRLGLADSCFPHDL